MASGMHADGREPRHHRASEVRSGTRNALSRALRMMMNADRAMRMGDDYARGAVNGRSTAAHGVLHWSDPTRAPAGMHTVKIVATNPTN